MDMRPITANPSRIMVEQLAALGSRVSVWLGGITAELQTSRGAGRQAQV